MFQVFLPSEERPLLNVESSRDDTVESRKQEQPKRAFWAKTL